MYRLNPFALPPETNGRFTLLIVAALAIIFRLAQAFIITFLGLSNTLDFDANAIAVTEFQTAVAAYLRFLGTLFFLIAVTSLVFFAVAFAIYQFHPIRLRKRQNLQKWPQTKDPLLQQEVARLAQLLEMVRTPQLFMPAQSKLTSGQAFGVPPHFALILGGRMPLLLRKRPQQFEAIVLHELAHIVNGDVRRTYFTQSLWVAVLALLFVPTLLFMLCQLPLGLVQMFTIPETQPLLTMARLLIFMLQFLLLILVLSLVRSSVLRIREEYADWLAAQHSGEVGLVEILSQKSERSFLDFLAAPWWLHPRNQDRLKSLEDSTQLFKLRFDLPIVFGVLVGMILVVTEYLGLAFAFVISAGWSSASRTLLSELMSSSVLLQLGLGLVFVPLIGLAMLTPFVLLGALGVRSLGVQLQRHALGRLASDHNGLSMRLPVAAFLLTAATGLGIIFVPFNPSTLPIVDFAALVIDVPVVLGQYLVEEIIWLLTSTGVVWLWFVVNQLWTRWSLGRHQGESTPSVKRLLLNMVQGLTLGLILVPMLIGQNLVYRRYVDSGIAVVPGIALGLMLTLLMLAAFLSAVYSLVLWFGSGFNSRLSCIHCQAQTNYRVAVGNLCPKCHRPMAPWLYVYRNDLLA